jgi:hypothetical protein
MPYKIYIQKEPGAKKILKPLMECINQGLLVLHHPETTKVYEDEGLLRTMKDIYHNLDLPTDWENWDVDDTPATVPWAGTPTSSHPAWDDLFASTNKKILLALKNLTEKKKQSLKNNSSDDGYIPHGTINELGILRHGETFMHAFPRAQRVPGKGLIRVAQSILYKGRHRVIHPFFTDRRALLHTEELVEKASDIMVESHTKEGFPFFTPTHDTERLPPTPNFGGGAARHVTLLASDPGIRGLPPSYMTQTEKEFPNVGFNFNRPMNYRDTMGYKETHVDPEADSQEATPLPEELGPIKAPTGDQSKHTDLGVPQATSRPLCAVLLAPISSSSRLHVCPMGQDVLLALKNYTQEEGTEADAEDVDFLDESLSRAVHLTAPPNTNLSNGIPLDTITLQMSQGQSCALLPCTPHAGAGLFETDTNRNLRLHIVLFNREPPLPTSMSQTAEAFISPPIFRQFCGERPQNFAPKP